MLSEAALKWLEGRSLCAETASRLGVTSTRRAGGEWLAFPVLRDGQTVATKYRCLDHKAFSQEAGGLKACFNEDALKDRSSGQPPILTEGEVDTLAAVQCGFVRVASVPDGAPAATVDDPQAAKYAYVERLLELLKDDREVIIAADGDDAGANLLHDLTLRLGRARCKFLRYPRPREGFERCKDLGDALQQYGRKGVEACIAKAQWTDIPGLVNMADVTPAPPMTVYRAGFHEGFDKRVGICKRHVSVWTGIPTHGKSAVVNAVKVGLAQRYGWRHAVLTLENEVSTGYRRDVARYLHDLPWEEQNDEHHAKTEAFLRAHYWAINPVFGTDVTLDWVIEQAEAAVVRHDCDAIWIDPWSKLDHEFHGERETKYTADALKLLERFAARFNVHVGVVAHPAKMAKDKDGHFEVPDGYSISGSAHWFNAPSLGVTVYRDAEAGPYATRIKIWKSKREAEMGQKGEFRMHFHPRTGRYSEHTPAIPGVNYDREDEF